MVPMDLLKPSSSEEDELPKPLSLDAVEALHPLPSKGKQPCARRAEGRPHASPRPRISPFCPRPGAEQHKAILVTVWSPSSPGLGRSRDAGSKEVVQTFIGVFMSSD